MHIMAAGNVEAPAWLVLRSRGYTVERHIRAHPSQDVWTASKGNQSFSGEGPIELLGVVTMFEERGNAWQASDPEISEFLTTFDMQT